MKKTYMKPEVNEIEVSANQAVAGCYLKTVGWQLNDQHSSTMYGSYEEAVAHQPDDASSTAYQIAPVYYYEGVIENSRECHGYWIDWNNNGVWDGYGVDNIQNQQDNVPNGLSTSWQGVLFNS